MIFGSQECFDWIYHKIKDDDYILDFHYRLVPEPMVVVTVTNRRHPSVKCNVTIPRRLWDDKPSLLPILSNFKTNYRDAFKSLKEAANF